MQNILEEIYKKLYEEKKVISEKPDYTLRSDGIEYPRHSGPIYKDGVSIGYQTSSGLDPDHVKVIFGDEYKGETMKFVKPKAKTTLVIPDAHVRPDRDLNRFYALGKLITQRRPDHIVIMGDFVTLESLSAWDLGKSGKMEGKRYAEDCMAGKKALTIIRAAITAANIKATYKPRFVYIMGNHEYRLDRYLETKPELDAHLDLVKDLALSEYGITDVVPYKRFLELEGVLFTHAVMNAANLPIGGKTALSMIAQSVSKSVVIGHLHRLETMNHFRFGAEDIIQIVSSGCFFDGVEDYADGGQNAYWRGVLLLTHYKEGRFDVDTISTDRLVRL